MPSLGFLTPTWHPLATMTPEERKREVARLDYETLIADAAIRVGYQVELGKSLLQALTVVNGGAIVALFTLIGNMGDASAIDPPMLKRAFAFFIAGLILSLVSGFAGFLSQFWYSLSGALEAWEKQDEMLGGEITPRNFELHQKRGDKAIWATVIAAALSATCFGIGGWAALSGVIVQSTTIVGPA